MAYHYNLKNYDVFINHRGPDVKKGLVSHLYAALKQVNFTTFVDSMEIPPTTDAWEAIKTAIRHSKVNIAVFSPGYAESRWCLDELLLFLQRSDSKDPPLFLPVFYQVQPSDLRLHPPSRPSCYRHSLEMLAERHDASVIDKWTQALNDASMINGFVFPDDFQGIESLLVEKVVGLVIDALSQQSLLSGPEHPVGLDEKLRQALEKMRRNELEGTFVRKLGICGMGGLGKSTLAKCIYNRIHRQFDSACFIEDVSKASITKGFTSLQEHMLQRLLHTKDISVHNTESGRWSIRHRLSGMKVLIILDNVSEKEQLDQLLPPRDSTCRLGKDSQIVITTRDQEVLTLAQAYSYIPMSGLCETDARELFEKNAFPDGSSRDSEFGIKIRLAEQIADACQGLPLALEVIGSHLRGKEISVWQNTAKALESRAKVIEPQRKVTGILKISFNALGSSDEKEMFLDIACFLKGEHKDKGLRIWGSMYNDEIADLNLKVLISKCLVKLSKDGELIMHDLLCAMGRDILDQSTTDYWDRTHLWDEKDVSRVLRHRKGTCHVRALASSIQRTWETASFHSMHELKLLKLSNVTLTGDFGNMPQELRWCQLRNFCWPLGTPLPFSKIGLDNIAVLDLEGSVFSSFDIDDCMLKSLKELNLKNCSELEALPAKFSEKSNNLEKLILSGCVNLQSFPDWIGKQSASLKYLDISSCRNITDLPDGVTSLRALTYLLMNNCSGLTRLPCKIGQLTALECIGLDRVPLDELPQSIGSLTLLKSLQLHQSCMLRELPSTIENLKWMTCLDIRSCPFISALPVGVTSLKSLRYLRVEDCENVCNLPTDLYHLWQLQELHVIYLRRLSSLPILDSLSKLECLSLKGCCSLAKVEHLPCALMSLDVSGCTSLMCLDMSGCRKLKTLSHGIESLKSLTTLLMHECDSLPGFADAMPQLTTLKEFGFDSVPLKSYPKSFEGLSNLTSLRFYSLPELLALPLTIGNLLQLTSLEIISCRRISEIPQTVVNLQNLVCFRVIDCKSLFRLPIIIGRIKHLEEFHVSIPPARICEDDSYVFGLGPTIWDIGLPTTGYVTFSSLKSIVLKGVSIPSLPEDYGTLPNVEQLMLKGSSDLKEVSYLPTSLVSLDLGGCSSLKRMLPLDSLTRLSSLELCGCSELVELNGLGCLPLLSCLDITDCSHLEVLTGLEKCTSLRSLFMARSGVRILQTSNRPWIQTVVPLEVVSLGGNVVPSYFLMDFQGYSCCRSVLNADVQDAWRLDIDVPERGDACKGILCCFVSKERFEKGICAEVRSASTWPVRPEGDDCNVEGWADNKDSAEARSTITWARTWVRAEVERNARVEFSQILFFNRVANWEDELHICILRESHPLVASLIKGGCRLSVIARSVYEVWDIEVSAGYVQLIYGENEMEAALRQLTLRQR